MLYVPSNLIRARSDIFHATVAAACPKGGKDEVVSIDSSPMSFSYHLHVLSTGEILEESAAAVYLLAVKLGDIVSSNLIMDEIFAILKCVTLQKAGGVRKAAAYAYKHAAKHSPLRHIVSTYAAFHISETEFEEEYKGWNEPEAAEFFYDVAMRWKDRSGVTTPRLQRDTFAQMAKEEWHIKAPAA